jgi:hypothetical protein
MPAQPDVGPTGWAKATNSVAFDTNPLRRGVGATGQAFTEAVGANNLPPLAVGISQVGGGPIAIAAAGVAVAVANADTPSNGGMQ